MTANEEAVVLLRQAAAIGQQFNEVGQNPGSLRDASLMNQAIQRLYTTRGQELDQEVIDALDKTVDVMSMIVNESTFTRSAWAAAWESFTRTAATRVAEFGEGVGVFFDKAGRFLQNVPDAFDWVKWGAVAAIVLFMLLYAQQRSKK